VDGVAGVDAREHGLGPSALLAVLQILQAIATRQTAQSPCACVVSCRVVSCRVVSCRVVSCRVVSCRQNSLSSKGGSV
jgi:hypothetical protein